jgi:hypothetical protein
MRAGYFRNVNGLSRTGKKTVSQSAAEENIGIEEHGTDRGAHNLFAVAAAFNSEQAARSKDRLQGRHDVERCVSHYSSRVATYCR